MPKPDQKERRKTLVYDGQPPAAFAAGPANTNESEVIRVKNANEIQLLVFSDAAVDIGFQWWIEDEQALDPTADDVATLESEPFFLDGAIDATGSTQADEATVSAAHLAAGARAAPSDFSAGYRYDVHAGVSNVKFRIQAPGAPNVRVYVLRGTSGGF